MSDLSADFNNVGRLLAHGAITVTNAQTRIKSGATVSAGLESFLIYNDSANTVYFGLTGVTTSGTTKGLPLAKGMSMVVDAISSDFLYLIATSGSNTCLIFEFGY